MSKFVCVLFLPFLLSASVHGQALGQRVKPAPEADPATVSAAWLEKAYANGPQPEAVKMLIAIARGSQMGPNDGWFGPGQTRYTWEWLARLSGGGPNARSIPADQFPGSPAQFNRLDRSKDGAIGPEDLDWSDLNPLNQQAYLINRLFRRIDSQGAGRITREEWQKFFDRAGQGKEYLTSDDLRDALLAGMGGGFSPGDAPDPAMLVRGLFAGEIGSMHEGPALDQPAPNFVLKTQDGRESVELAKLIGKKPVVLVFGNFTCGPFRSMYPGVEEMYQRYKDQATFLMVYVREAHPTNGWAMESNRKVGVAVPQPTTFEQRCEVAGAFCEKLKPTLPVLVDEITDVVGHAYSGMPARMYVIDLKGKVAYKSGRGPFGFKVGEMEQALIFTLIDGMKR